MTFTRTRLALLATGALLLLGGVIEVGGCVASEMAIQAEAARRSSETYQQERAARFQQCEKLGGVPIRSGWDGDLKHCQFPPAAQGEKR